MRPLCKREGCVIVSHRRVGPLTFREAGVNGSTVSRCVRQVYQASELLRNVTQVCVRGEWGTSLFSRYR